MAQSQIRYIQRCLKAVCEASSDVLRLCNLTDVEKARRNLASISPSSLEFVVESGISALQTPFPLAIDYPVSQERGSDLPTSTGGLPELQERDQVLSPGSGGIVKPKSPEPIIVPSETLFRSFLSQRERVKLLVQQTPEEALGFCERNPGLDYERLKNGLDADKYGGHHSIIWFYDEYTKSSLSMADYVTSLELPEHESKQQLQILGDGRKLRTIDDGFKERFDKRLGARNTLQDNRLELELSQNADVEGALIPWLSLHHKLWSRMGAVHIPNFLDLCISHQEILDCAPDYSAFYKRCKDHYQSEFTDCTNKARPTTQRGRKRKHSLALDTQQQRSTHCRVGVHGMLQSGTETSVAQHASGSPSQNLRTGDGEDSSEVPAVQLLDQTTAHRHATGCQDSPSLHSSDTSRTQSINATAIRTVADGNMAAFDSAVNNPNMAACDDAVAHNFNTVPDGFNDGNMAAFDSAFNNANMAACDDDAVAHNFNTVPDGFNDGNMAAFDSAFNNANMAAFDSAFNNANIAACDDAVAHNFNTVPDGFNDGNMAAFDDAVAHNFITVPDGFNDGNMAAFDDAVAHNFITVPDGFNDGNMVAFDDAVADSFSAVRYGYNDRSMVAFDDAVADGFSAVRYGFNDGNIFNGTLNMTAV